MQLSEVNLKIKKTLGQENEIMTPACPSVQGMQALLPLQSCCWTDTWEQTCCHKTIRARGKRQNGVGIAHLLLLLRERDCGRRSSGSVTSDFFFFFLTEDDTEEAERASKKKG
jgi:hypothetical protein